MEGLERFSHSLKVTQKKILKLAMEPSHEWLLSSCFVFPTHNSIYKAQFL